MWLKAHYPAEFFAASMSILDSDELPGLVEDAGRHGITVRLPDINLSELYFNPVHTGSTCEIVAPLSVVKGLSTVGVNSILEARKSIGRFNTILDLLENVSLRSIHKGIQEKLDKVGVFAGLDFSDPDLRKKVEKAYPHLSLDQSPVTDPSRKSDQLAWISGLTRVERVVKFVSVDTNVKQRLQDEVISPIFESPCQGCSLSCNAHVPPRFGRSAKAMVVFDGPTYGDESKGKMVEGLGSEYIKQALEKSGFSVSDFYWTTLVKSRKPKGKQYVNEHLNGCSKYLDLEISILQPGLIVALGSAVLKHLAKHQKFTQSDACKVIHVGGIDAAVLVGINPQAVYADPEKQSVVNDIFMKAKGLIQ
jgi:DNA polymerase-3 subunit alpha